jgi:pSer/pThr/pTyr-binding forkhead associated (FHA) protein
VPKGKPFPDGEEEEKTTIESQWEDEASTTVEEGDVADKIRELGVESRRPQQTGTHTGAGTMDELTVDEAHAQSAITPVRDVARLMITQGNDAGQEIEIRPGKAYTIGRAIDNDVVLTDIAVSRKHFDLRFEDGAWVIIDRGSGNGTVVNGNLEDNPFMLANGDAIEIGNTVFRFDQPNAAPRPQPTMDLDGEEELSTVAGRPMRGDDAAIGDRPSMRSATRQPRPKTLPPPTPLRAANASQPPPLAFAHVPAAPVLPSPVPLPPQPGVLPLPQMAGRTPLATPGAPTMLADQLGVPPNGLPISIPSQGAAPQPRAQYAYPQASEIPPHSVHAQMLHIQTQHRRGDASTAHVSPTPYDGIAQPSPRYLAPELSQRAKLVLGGIGLAVFAGVLTIAITKSGGGSSKPVAAETKSARPASPAKAAAKTTPAEKPSAETAATEADEPTTTNAKPAITAPPTTTTTTAPTTTTTRPTTTPRPTTTESVPSTAAKTPPSSPPATPPTPAKVTKVEPPKVTKVASPKVTKVEPPKAPKKIERREPVDSPPSSKRVAALDPDQVKNQADNLYRARKFNEASGLLANAAKKTDGDDARDLRRTSEMYARLGRAYAQGTAPATKPTEAFEALRQAQSYDRSAGNAFDGEIQNKLAQVAPKAALSYMAAKNYPAARSAVIVAQQFGASESVKLVNQKLESVASDLYNEGLRELDSNPSAAKEKFRQIKSIVDAKSTWYKKAHKQLQGS